MNNLDNQTVKKSVDIKDMVTTALLISLVFVATRSVNIRLPISYNGGLIHMGNTMLFTAAIVFGGKMGAAAGAFGMALFDLQSEWAAWAPFTFIVRGIMGYIIGKIAHLGNNKGNNMFYNLLGILIAAIWMIAGYYLTEIILYGNWLKPVTSIPGNITQIVIGAAVAIPLSKLLKNARISQ